LEVAYEKFAHLSVFGGISFSASENTAEMVVSFSSFEIYRFHVTAYVTMFSPENVSKT